MPTLHRMPTPWARPPSHLLPLASPLLRPQGPVAQGSASEPGPVTAVAFRAHGGPAPRPRSPGLPGAPAAPGGGSEGAARHVCQLSRGGGGGGNKSCAEAEQREPGRGRRGAEMAMEMEMAWCGPPLALRSSQAHFHERSMAAPPQAPLARRLGGGAHRTAPRLPGSSPGRQTCRLHPERLTLAEGLLPPSGGIRRPGCPTPLGTRPSLLCSASAGRGWAAAVSSPAQL